MKPHIDKQPYYPGQIYAWRCRLGNGSYCYGKTPKAAYDMWLKIKD
jgi:hypothetical protein